MENEKKYEMRIDPSILELLGPNLYTNIYYILAELIANAYDADARNVYVIEKEGCLIVEDDGHGMSYKNKDIERYLQVAESSRKSEAEAFSKLGTRKKMGRKGVGKLAALSISEIVKVMTIFDGEKSGFILARHPRNGYVLDSIPEDEIVFENIANHGTAIVMTKPQYLLNKTLDTVKKNLIKIFPLVDKNFRIHLLKDGKNAVLESIDKTISSELCSIITLGKDFEKLADGVCSGFETQSNQLIEKRSSKVMPIKIKDNKNEDVEINLEIKGWIGSYKSTRGRKKDILDFSDNFLSLYANKKMGEFNILPLVGQNKMTEVYIVGQLHVDEFENSDLPDMALSNRQGYKSDDERYKKVLEFVKAELLPDALKLRQKYTDLQNKNIKDEGWKKNKVEEENFKSQIDRFKTDVSNRIAEKMSNQKENSLLFETVENSINETLPDLGIKRKIDASKKKILISQTSNDKQISDVVYQMLLYNGVPAKDILYSNCDNEECRIPEGRKVFDYLRDFFVDSYSTQKMYVLFVTSKNTKVSWGTMMEIGAQWITQCDNKVFNVKPYRPEQPLDNETSWCNVSVDKKTKNITSSTVEADKFCSKIEDVCEKMGYNHQDRINNKQYLSTLIDIV